MDSTFTPGNKLNAVASEKVFGLLCCGDHAMPFPVRHPLGACPANSISGQERFRACNLCKVRVIKSVRPTIQESSISDQAIHARVRRRPSEGFCPESSHDKSIDCGIACGKANLIEESDNHSNQGRRHFLIDEISHKIELCVGKLYAIWKHLLRNMLSASDYLPIL